MVLIILFYLSYHRMVPNIIISKITGFVFSFLLQRLLIYFNGYLFFHFWTLKYLNFKENGSLIFTFFFHFHFTFNPYQILKMYLMEVFTIF